MNNLLECHFDTLVITEEDIILCDKDDIYEGAYGSDLCCWGILIKDEDELTRPNEQLVYSEDAYLEDMYEIVENGDKDKIYMDCDFDCDPIAVRKLSKLDSDIQNRFVDIEHGINTDTICITNADIMSGKAYKAPLYTAQKYPEQEYEDAFLFIDEDGNKTFLKRTSPFFSDEDRDIFEEISEEEFKEFCD